MSIQFEKDTWHVTRDDKEIHAENLRQEILEKGNVTDKGKPSKKGVNTKTVIYPDEESLNLKKGGFLSSFRNRAKEGDLSVDKFNFADQGAKEIEKQLRESRKTYSGPGGLEASKAWYANAKSLAITAEAMGLGKTYAEHRTPLSQYHIFGSKLHGSDDVQNLVQRVVDSTKDAKDTMESLSEKYNYAWATDIDPDDALQVVNAIDWDPDDHLGKGITMSKRDVDLFNRYLKKGFDPEITAELKEKFGYLSQMLGNDNGNGNGNGNVIVNGKKKKNGWVTRRNAAIGAGALISSVSFLPSVDAAEKTQEHLDNKEYKQAAVTYGKDLIIGDVKGRAALKGFTSASKFLANKGVNKVVRRKLITLAGRQLAKKGIALAAGPAAPILLTALLIKDVYDVANVVSRGKLNEGVKDLFTQDQDPNTQAEKAMSLDLNI